MRSVLDCGCVIDDSGRHLCPTCADGGQKPKACSVCSEISRAMCGKDSFPGDLAQYVKGLIAKRMYEEGAIDAVVEERNRQDAKWGEQNHSPEWWHLILAEEVGELAQAILSTHVDACQSENLSTSELPAMPMAYEEDMDEIQRECVHVAATALAFLECLLREGKRAGPKVDPEDQAKQSQAPCPICNRTGVFNYGPDETCPQCHGKGFLTC
jgi:NTP pyrophosphatase (non-canonical NTP hydrolase)